MSRFAHVGSAFVLSVLLAATAAAQQPTPTISSIPPRKAFDLERIAILGSNLGLVTDVRVNGIVAPIVRVTGTRIVVGPVPPQDPGFGTVELIHGRGIVTGTIELTPTLRAERRGLRLTSTLRNGDVGAYVLRFDYERLPAPVVEPGIYYGRLLPLDAQVLSAGTFADAEPLTILSRMPIEVGLIGAPLSLQAQCVIGVEAVQSYSNLAAVPGFGQHQ
jgi:hypothetical protein